MALESTAKSRDFQAEYEGSIPFTRSNFSLGIGCARSNSAYPSRAALRRAWRKVPMSGLVHRRIAASLRAVGPE
jgi:hypothetical protein